MEAKNLVVCLERDSSLRLRSGQASLRSSERQAIKTSLTEYEKAGDQTMTYDFDRRIDRRGSGSVKWDRYGEDVLDWGKIEYLGTVDVAT